MIACTITWNILSINSGIQDLFNPLNQMKPVAATICLEGTTSTKM